MKHIVFAVIAAAALAVIGPRISEGHAQIKDAAAAPHELIAPSDYRAAPLHDHSSPELPTLHFRR